ncbi:MAG: DUF1559 domain-containing protein [Pirellulaceae bacterium]
MNFNRTMMLKRTPLALLLVVACWGCGSEDPVTTGPSAADPVSPSASSKQEPPVTEKQEPKLVYEKIERTRAGQARARMKNSNKLKKVAIGIHIFHDTYRQFPVGESPIIKYREGQPLLSWRVHLLPFVEEVELYKQFKLDQPWDSPDNLKLLEKIPEVYQNQDYKGLGSHTTVLAINGPGAVFNPSEKLHMRDVTDGTSQTVLIINAGPDKAVPWTKPQDLTYQPDAIVQSLGDVNDPFMVMFADGAIYPVRKTVDERMLLRMFQRNDGKFLVREELK